jgi:hypothetical protein
VQAGQRQNGTRRKAAGAARPRRFPLAASLALTGLLMASSAFGAGQESNIVANAAVQQPHAGTPSMQDLSLFGILGLGIIGLLWIRRHTSEL